MKYHDMLYFTLMFFLNYFSLLTNFDLEAEEQAMHGFCMQECMPPGIPLEKKLPVSELIKEDRFG